MLMKVCFRLLTRSEHGNCGRQSNVWAAFKRKLFNPWWMPVTHIQRKEMCSLWSLPSVPPFKWFLRQLRQNRILCKWQQQSHPFGQDTQGWAISSTVVWEEIEYWIHGAGTPHCGYIRKSWCNVILSFRGINCKFKNWVIRKGFDHFY